MTLATYKISLDNNLSLFDRMRAAEVAAPRILLAEDDAAMRAMLAQALRRDGYDVIEVHDGGELLMRIEQAMGHGDTDRPFDLVISDVRMPYLSGVEVLAELWRIDSLSTPVILITAFGDPSLHEEAQQLGAVAVIDKPFELEDIRTAVRYYMHRSS